MDEKLIRETFPQKLKYYMQLHDKKRNDLVHDLNFKYSTIRDWEKGITIPRMDKAEALARYFNITTTDLIGEQEESSPSVLSTAEVGAELKKKLAERNLSPVELDKKAGVKTGTTTKIINGKYEPHIDVAMKISAVIGMPASFFLGIQEHAQSISKQKFRTRLYQEIPDLCLTDEEITEIINYIKYLISKRK